MSIFSCCRYLSASFLQYYTYLVSVQYRSDIKHTKEEKVDMLSVYSEVRVIAARVKRWYTVRFPHKL